MGVFTFGIGKGLKEPCSPYREAYFFGAELNEPSADNWNCIPTVVSPTTSFDLSTISEGKEIAVAFLGVSNTLAGTYHIRFRWYRDRDDALLYDYTFDHTPPRGGWIYGYSYIGYVGWEIIENGGYVVEIEVTGAESYIKKIPFTVSGIPVEEPEPIPTDGFLPAIIAYVLSIASFFLSLKEEVEDWVFPFYYIAPVFLYIADAFARLAYQFERFSDWVDYATDRVKDILNFTQITLALKTWLDYATWAWNWVRNAWYNVRAIVVDWWGTVIPTVYGWIDEAKQWASLQIDSLEKWIANLQADVAELLAQIPDVSELTAWFSNWWGNILANLTWWWNEKLLDINSLFRSWTLELEPFWAGWQDWRDKVVDFFTDPEEWLYKAVDRIIERFW